MTQRDRSFVDIDLVAVEFEIRMTFSATTAKAMTGAARSLSGQSGNLCLLLAHSAALECSP